jgi:hypothetical protein
VAGEEEMTQRFAFKVKLNARKVTTLENVGQMIDYLDGVLNG